MQNVVLVCEDSLEGVFSAIYFAYEKHYNHENTRISVEQSDNLELFTSYVNTISDKEKATKVIRKVLSYFGRDTYLTFCKALATQSPDKADAVYHVLELGLRTKNCRIIENYANGYVNTIFELSRHAGNEILHWKEFLRFQELEKGILYARIGPENNVITFIAPHFADRLPRENFIIYDEIRNLCVVHPSGKNWFLMDGSFIKQEETRKFSETERLYRDLFTFFCHKIAIQERKNIALQTQMCALHFQKYMSEFNLNV